jgi:selenocysteine lyase/cysteine desulfurase/S-adenosylmethionine/arginine decarboxylase-like enzyme
MVASANTTIRMRRDVPGPQESPVLLIGADAAVPCLDGRSRRYVNLDYAASTPVMGAVWEAVETFVPWYSSVHRGSGLKSQLSTAAYEDARDTVAAFVGARAEDAVVFVRNTTEAINVLSAALPLGTRVLSSAIEHHSNLLPWRRHDPRLLPFTGSPDELLDVCERALRTARPRIDLVAVTGASNVTGEVWPICELAERAHAHGARLFVDAAQLAPHRRIDIAGAGIDFLAFSGHKLYAPFGAGALVGDARRLGEMEPLLHGGGAIELVTHDDVIWADAPDRHEAGSPNVVGAVALAAACRALLELGMETVVAHERALSTYLWSALPDVPGLRRLTLWPDYVDRVGVATFNLDGYRHPLLAAILSAEHAIGVRHGCFCAHPLMTRLLGIPDSEVKRLAAELQAGRRPALPGAVRASIGLGTTTHDIDRLIDALHDIASTGPRSHYLQLPGLDEYHPEPHAATKPPLSPPRTADEPRRDPTLARWGMLAAIDLHGCERRLLEDPDTIRRFVPSVIEVIGMRAHGPLHLERFGDGELEGWSAMQFIETSSITIHADEVSGRCFVDVFSCREFDAEIAAAIAVAHFGGTPTVTVLER